MYLKKLMEKAVLKEEPHPEQDIVLISPTVVSWCDIPMCISRSDWEEIYTKLLPSEPDIELISRLIMKADSREFLAKFANEEQVRQRYEQLQCERVQELCEQTVEPEPEQDFISLKVAATPVHTSPVEEVEEDTSTSPIDTYEAPTYAPSVEDEPSAETWEPVQMLAEEEPVSSETGEAEACTDEGMAPVMSPAVGPSISDSFETTDVETDYTTEEAEVAEEFCVEVTQSEEASRLAEKKAQLEELLVAFAVTQEPALPEYEWAFGCCKLFYGLMEDIKNLRTQITLDKVFKLNNTTGEEVLEKWAACNGKPPLDKLETFDDMLILVKVSYVDCLKFLSQEMEAEALQLASILSNLFYEEEPEGV